MASRAIQLKLDMEKAGQTYGHSKIEVDTRGYRDYRGVPVFGAWLWNADLGFGLATEIDVAEALSNYYQIRQTVFGVLGFTLFLSVGAVLLVLILGERTSRALRKSQDELELRVQERTAELRKLSQATENSPASVVVTDKNGTIEYVNPRFSEVTGYSAEEVIGRNPKVLKSGNLPESYYKELWDTILSGKVWRGEFNNIRKNGEEFWESASISPIMDEEGEITHFVAVKQDTTERKKMETALLAEHEQLQKILDTSPVGVGISTEGVVRFANPRFAELFYSKEGEDAQQAYVNPEDREHIVAELERSGIVRDYDLQTYGRKREIRDTLATFIRTEYEGQTGILSWLVDLSGLKEAERELKAKFDELARFRRLAIGREQKMIELKKEINDLLKSSELSEKYKIHGRRNRK
jgi:polar amino acid transport system substrate-binding protein